jgi:biopolymer transport protein ExbD
MAEIITSQNSHQKHKSFKRIHLDMTPMVDLAFLLLTFFILATSLERKTVMEIVYPQDGPATRINWENVTVVVVGEDGKSFYYRGEDAGSATWHSDELLPHFLSLNFPVHDALQTLREQKEKGLISDEEFKQKRSYAIAGETKPVIIIKTGERTAYRDVIEVVDDLQISDIQRYTIQDMSEVEKNRFKELILVN